MFGFTYKHLSNGRPAFELECEISASVQMLDSSADPEISISAIKVEFFGVDLAEGDDPASKALAAAIERAALADPDFCAEVIDREGLFYVGAANDPDGRWRAA